MFPAFLFFLALALPGSLAIDDGSACRYLTNLLEDLPRRIPTTTFKSNKVQPVIGEFTVSLGCDTEASDSQVWCMFFNDANCTCNDTQLQSLNVTADGPSLQWKVSKSNVVIYDGTLIGCFQEDRLVTVVYVSGTDEEPPPAPGSDLVTVQIWSVVIGLISTAAFVLPCCGLSYYMTLRKPGGPSTAVKAFRRISAVPGVQNANVRSKDVEQVTKIGNGRFGEVWKAEVKNICQESPLQKLACIKIFQDSAQSGKMQRVDALRIVEFRMGLTPNVNIINYLGAYSSGGKVALVVELGVFGTLYSFLEGKRRARMHSGSYTALEEGRWEHLDVAYARGCSPPATSELESIFTAPLESTLTNEDVLAIAEQIAKGLLHLNQLSIVHQRLTCESVYIGANYMIKVGGFAPERHVPLPPGMRRPSMMDNGPQLTERTPCGRQLAWWSAPEVIECLSYSQASDVWSFAMTVWELASDGDTPMQGCGARRTADLPEVIRSKKMRPLQPAACSEMLFSIMQECWQAEPLKRPGMATIKMQLSQLLHSQGQGQPNPLRMRMMSPPSMPQLLEDEEEQ